MEKKPNYGAIHDEDKNSEPRTEERDHKAIDIEEALTEAGFKWTQARYLLVVSFIEVVMVADVEGVTFLGPLLLCRWNLTGIEESLLGTSFYVAAILGSLVWGKFADMYGRKTTLRAMALISAVSFFGIALSQGIYLTLSCLFFAGLSKGGYFILFTYPTEIVGCSRRTSASFFIFLAYALGSVFGSLLAMVTIPHHSDLWRLYFGILCILHFIGFFLLFLLAESPRYLLVSGRPDKALEIIRRFNPEKNRDVVLKPATAERRGSLNDLLSNKEYKKNVVISTLVGLSIGAIMIGTVMLFLESLQNPEAHSKCIFVRNFEYKKVCDELTTYDYALESASSTTGFLVAFLAKFMSDIMGRRNGLLIDGYLMTLISSLYLFCKPKIVQTILAAFSRIVTNTAQTVSVLYASELFPTSIRGTAVGITMAGSALGQALAPFLAVYLAKVNHPAAVAIFIALALLWVILMHIMEHETKDEIQLEIIEESREK